MPLFVSRNRKKLKQTTERKEGLGCHYSSKSILYDFFLQNPNLERSYYIPVHHGLLTKPDNTNTRIPEVAEEPLQTAGSGYHRNKLKCKMTRPKVVEMAMKR